MYPRKRYYWAVMSADVVLRFMWLSTLIPPVIGDHYFWIPPAYLSPLIEA